ncbi:MAG: tRNA pseudouridine(13) synthase TruD [Candidatus Woesearchaeota archaeon]
MFRLHIENNKLKSKLSKMICDGERIKLRQCPEDFKVEEIAKFDIYKEPKAYKLYILEKKGVETFSLLEYLSKQNNIPLDDFKIAGIKDRHAVTKQHFTIPSRYSIDTLKEENFSITFKGYLENPLKLGELQANRFEITARAILKGELDGIKMKSATICSLGVPNYFDSQRFGSVVRKMFIAKALIQKDYEGAVKIYLTAYPDSESRRNKDEKDLILQNWSALENVKVTNRNLQRVIDEYNRTKDGIAAYRKIPSQLRELFISSYQSYLWNECAKMIIIYTLPRKITYPIEYNLGKLYFYKNVTEQQLKELPETLKTISDQIKPTEYEAKIIGKLLQKESLTISDFNIKSATGNFFKTHDRALLVRPIDFRISEPLHDEHNSRGRKCFKIVVSFTLPKGSYATIVTKRIFNS